MCAVPFITVTSSYARKIRSSAFAAELEWPVIDSFACNRIVAIAFCLGTEGSYHLGVAAVATFADIDVTPGKLQRGIGLQSCNRLCC